MGNTQFKFNSDASPGKSNSICNKIAEFIVGGGDKKNLIAGIDFNEHLGKCPSCLGLVACFTEIHV